MDRENTKNCRHETTESLGFDHGMEFLRCLNCRSVIVTQGGVNLAIPPARLASHERVSREPIA
jgi:ribosomal protein S27E